MPPTIPEIVNVLLHHFLDRIISLTQLYPEDLTVFYHEFFRIFREHYNQRIGSSHPLEHILFF